MTQTILEQESVVKENTRDLPALIGQVNAITIKNHSDYSAAFKFTQSVKARFKELDALRKSLTAPLDETKKRIMDLFREPLANLTAAETKLKTVMIAYDEEQEKIRLAAEAKLREQAEREAEKERQKLLVKAEKAAVKGNEEKADELREQAAEVAPVNVTLANTAPSPEGGSFRMQYTAEVFDFKALPDDYKIADLKALNAIVQAKKGVITIPGVKVLSRKIMSVR